MPRRRRAHAPVAIALAATAGAAFAACFPAYDFSSAEGAPDSSIAVGADGTPPGPGPAGSDGGSDATVGPGDDGGGADPDADAEASTDAPVTPPDAAPPPFDASDMIRVPEGGAMIQGVPATLTHAFYVDRYEVSVARFKAFVSAGLPLPCDGGACSLDPSGPYKDAMKWDPSWNSFVGAGGYATGCGSAQNTTITDPTFDDGNDAYPIGCVSWFQAVAMCAFESKRLPTETEWEYVASGRGLGRAYPWGNDAPAGCGKAIWYDGLVDDAGDYLNGCHWPVVVGTAKDGGSRDGVFDLSGSVYEWVWDEVDPYSGGTDPITAINANASTREDRGGSFASDVSRLATTYRDETPPGDNFTDIGFRCAKTIP